jgi:hypothetical protein
VTEVTFSVRPVQRYVMRLQFTVAVSILVVVSVMRLNAQDLAPRAYLITPVHSNAATLTWAFYDGGVNFNGTVPITGATGVYNVPVFSFYHSLSFFGRSANITASLPFAKWKQREFSGLA